MITHGAKRTFLDRRDYSFSRSFGITSELIADIEYNLDAGLTIPDQDADGRFYACTGYAQADIAGDEDKAIYDPEYTYAKTCFIEGHAEDVGCDIRNSLKVGQAYGMKLQGQDGDPLLNRRGAFYSVDKISGMDWFDAHRVAMRTAKKPISTGTIWFREWMNGPVLTPLFVYDGKPNDYNWHDYKICGEKIIGGIPYLIVKPWLGKNWGDNGFGYVSRETFNRAFDIYGTCSFIQGHYTPKDINTIRLTLLQFALYYIGRLLNLQLAYA